MNAMVHPGGGNAHDQRSREPKTKIVVDFGGVNLRANRQAIGDNEFRWLENMHPVGPGNMPVTAPPGSTLQTIASQTPVSVWPMNLSSVDYDFVVMSSGHIYQVKKTTPYTATQITAVSGALFNSGQTALAQWENTIVLVVDPVAGYWFWNGATLTAISNTVAYVTITDPGVYDPAVGPPTATITGGGGAGSVATVYAGVVACVVAAGGTGYAVGDILTLNMGGFVIGGDQATVKVATIGGAGAIATVTIQTAGESLGALSGNPVTSSGGGGTGATFTVSYGVTAVLVTGGSGYTGSPGVAFAGAATRAATGTVTTSGSLLGNTIATFAGRVWIGSGRTIVFTDVASYSSFAGAGGALTIDDETLHGNITALEAANSFLYITGDDSFDILGDVQVTDGITSFTRQNVTSSVGTTLMSSIFPFYRSLYFANTSGFYALSGSTPQKVSDNLDGLFPYIDFTKPVTGGQVMVNNILCPAFMFTFTDVFTGLHAGGARPILAVRSRDKWFFANPGANAKLISASPIAGVASLFVWGSSGGNAIFYQLFVPTSTNFQVSQMISRLWDGEAPLYAKQQLRQAVGINWNSQSNAGSSISINTDNEFTSLLSTTMGPSQMPTDSSYTLTVAPALTGGEGKYFGFTIDAIVQQIVFQLLVVEYVEGKFL